MENQTPNNSLPRNNETSPKKEWIMPEMVLLDIQNGSGATSLSDMATKGS